MITKCISALSFACFALSGFAQSAAPAPRPAQDLLKEAYKTAARTKKSVWVVFHASWCGWCHKLEETAAKPEIKSILDKYVVTVRLDVLENDDKLALENPGGRKVLEAVKGTKEGLPFFYFADAKGKVLINSCMKGPRSNVGCPAKPEEVAHFLKMLKTAAPKMTDAEQATIKAAFAAIDTGH